MTRITITCEKCLNKCRRHWKYKNTLLCHKCYIKQYHRLPMMNKLDPKEEMKRALEKVYVIRGHKRVITNSGGKYPAISVNTISPPTTLIGHKVRFVLADKEK